MKRATLISIGCLAAACWIVSVSPAEACSCSPPETLVARDWSFAVFEGTVVNQRITLNHTLPIFAAEQDIVVKRVWKGDVTNQVSVLYLNHGMCSGAAPVGATALFFMVQEQGRVAYGLCSSGMLIADAAPALAQLGPPIATFDDDPAPALIGAAALPPWRRLNMYVATAVVYYFNASDDQLQRLQYRPPLHAGPGLMVSVLFVLLVALLSLASARLRRLSVPLVVTSVMTVGCLLVWVGHDLASRPEIVEVLFYR
jgi:hypothetical protein